MDIEESKPQGDAPLRVIFCDADSAHVKQYALVVQQVCSVRGIPAKVLYYPTGMQLLADLEQHATQPTILITESELPDYQGIDALRQIREFGIPCQIIFLAKTPAYALEGYEVEAIAYLLKGATSPTVFSQALFRAMDNVVEAAQQYITFSCAGHSQTIRLTDIFHFEVVQKIVTVHYREGTFDFYSTLGKIEDTLGAYGFVRVHRNFVVSLSQITRHDNDEIVLDSGAVIPVGRNYRKDVMAALHSLESNGLIS